MERNIVVVVGYLSSRTYVPQPCGRSVALCMLLVVKSLNCGRSPDDDDDGLMLLQQRATTSACCDCSFCAMLRDETMIDHTLYSGVESERDRCFQKRDRLLTRKMPGPNSFRARWWCCCVRDVASGVDGSFWREYLAWGRGSLVVGSPKKPRPCQGERAKQPFFLSPNGRRLGCFFLAIRGFWTHKRATTTVCLSLRVCFR